MILILADEKDAHVPYVTRRLDAHGRQYFHFDPQHFPAKTRFSIDYSRSGTVHRILSHPRSEIDLSRVRAVWNRARVRPVAEASVDDEQKWWVAEGCSRWLAELWECLDCLWLPNRPLADRDPHRFFDSLDRTRQPAQPPRLRAPSGYNKLHQLTVASRLGFAIPRTLVTNSPERFLEFYEECRGQLVSKTTNPLRTARDGEKREAYTYRVQRRDAANYQAIRYAPVVFQEQVPKKLELRVTVVGDRVFPVAIQSQESRMLSQDWRHFQDFAPSRYYSVYALPAKIERRCARLVSNLGLCFGAIDLILTPQQEYVFLEVNPNGQWAWIEDFTGLPISEAVAELLIRGHV